MKKEKGEHELNLYYAGCLKTVKKLLVKLANNHGWFIIEIADKNLYCQLRRNETEGKTRFEAVSHYYNKALRKTLDKNFRSLGFQVRKDQNYAKKILLYSDDDVNKTAAEIMDIFIMHYGIDDDSIFEFKDLIIEN